MVTGASDPPPSESAAFRVAVGGSSLGWSRGPGLGVLLVLGVTLVGTLGYVVIEGWNPWDAFYMTVISVTTVGYGYPHPLSRAGEAWTSLVLVAGVGTLFYTASVLMGQVVEGGLHRGLEQRRFKRMLDDLTNHFIICGYGRIGSTIAEEFRRQGVPYVVIDRDAQRVHEIIAGGGALQGRGTMAVRGRLSAHQPCLAPGCLPHGGAGYGWPEPVE